MKPGLLVRLVIAALVVASALSSLGRAAEAHQVGAIGPRSGDDLLDRQAHAEWTSPMTNRLLLEAVGLYTGPLLSGFLVAPSSRRSGCGPVSSP